MEGLGALNGFTGTDLMVAGFVVCAVILGSTLLKLFLPNLLEHRYKLKEKIVDTNSMMYAKALDSENNAMLKQYSDRFDRIEQVFETDLKERQRRQTETDKQFADMVLALKAQQEEIKELRIEILQNTVYTEDTPMYNRFHAAHEYFKLGGNHNCKQYVITELLSQSDDNRKLWSSVVNEDKSRHKCKNSGYKETMADIKKALL